MRITEQRFSTSEWEKRLGDDFRAERLRTGHDQLELAALAGVSVGALRNLERGTGTTLKTLVGVARALGREDWLESLSPRVSVSPLELARSGPAARERVYRPRTRQTT